MQINLPKSINNKIFLIAVIVIMFVVFTGMAQVVYKNVTGDKALATVSSNYLSLIGFNTATPVSGAFLESSKICQSIDSSCVDDGILEYKFDTLSEKTNINDALGGGLTLSKKDDKFVENGTITSQVYNIKPGFSAKLTKIQLGIGLKPENVISMAYSVDAGTTYKTVVGNFTYDQLKAQNNQTQIEYVLPVAETISGGISFRVALKSDSKSISSPSLKYVRLFYDASSSKTTVIPDAGKVQNSDKPQTNTPNVNSAGADSIQNPTDNSDQNGSASSFLPVPGGSGTDNTPSIPNK